MQRPRIFATSDIGSEALDRLRERGWETVVHDPTAPPARDVLLQRLGEGVDALITTLRDPIDADVIATAAAAGCRVIAQIAVGLDNVDVAAASRHRIPVCNTADVLTAATAEFAFFMMGAVARRTWPAEQLVREGTWSTWHPMRPWLGDEVTGRTLAVIGCGRIGRSVVAKAMGFDMDVLCVSRRRDPEYVDRVRRVIAVRAQEGLAAREQTIEEAELDDALARADFVTLHVPLSRPGTSDEPTLHLVDERRLRLMKPTAFLVNTSRGPVVDEAALARALRERWIAGAALDVFATEPLPRDSPLLDPDLSDRLRLFPHAASAARATRLSADPDVGMAGRTVQAVIDVLEGRYGGNPADMPYVANREAFR